MKWIEELQLLHLDSKDLKVLEECAPLWKDMPIENAQNPHILMHRYITYALSLQPSSQALLNARYEIEKKLRQSSLIPFQEDPQEKEELNMLFDDIDFERHCTDFHCPADEDSQIAGYAEDEELLPPSYELSEILDLQDDPDWDADREADRAAVWESDWEAERIAEWKEALIADLE